MILMSYGGFFEVDSKKERIKKLGDMLNDPEIWSDAGRANEVSLEQNNLKKSISMIVSIKDEVVSSLELLDLLVDEYDEDTFVSICSLIDPVKESIDKLKLEMLLSNEYDHMDCILEVHSGAGGTEACDWAEMLFRMYNRWALNKNYKVELLSYLDGDEAGIKKASILIRGLNAYGYLKCEKGVHRLVRLSPFDANNKRHTSFASVDVTPLFDKSVDIELKDDDLKIDVYHSSGAGGQSVNTTDSAVRITHLPSKIVVTCQNERSQLKNKEKAIEILKNKLKMLEIEKQERELANLKGDNVNIEFGSQIRSYVMHPYSMVKDHRTNVQTSNVDKVLDGDIDMFINEYLRSM